MNRSFAMAVSLILSLAFNALAGVITLAYRNGVTIIETNPANRVLLIDLGPGALLVRAVEIVSLYSLAYLLSLALSSRSRLLQAKRIYLFTFALLIGLIPAAAFADFLGDVMVVGMGSDLLSGFERILFFGLAIAVTFAAVQVSRRWTLPFGEASHARGRMKTASGD